MARQRRNLIPQDFATAGRSRGVLLVVLFVALLQVQCGHAPNGGGIVDNGNKPGRPDPASDTPPADGSTADQAENFVKAQLNILDRYVVDVTSTSWSVRKDATSTQLSDRKTVIVFTRSTSPLRVVDETTAHGVAIAWTSPTQTNFLFADGSLVWAGHDARTAEIDAILRTLREKATR